ncbi:MAG TPA: hypothetical protein VJ793_12640 [Anaerolineae bacterium]|nr:hypothetical protein [Anaerolineae bacterium]
MPRLQAIALAGIIAVSAALALSLLMVVSAQAAPALAGVEAHSQALGVAAGNALGVAGSELAASGQNDPLSIESIIAAQAPITCTVTTTTTDEVPGNNSFATAATLATYTSLSLLAVSPAPPGQVPTLDDYFRLDNATPGFKYTVDAIPNGTGNYNLGIIVYDNSFTAVFTDTNTLDGVSARGELVAKANASPYYFRITQISASCSGGTYRLVPTTTVPPTETPTPGADRYEPNNNFDEATLVALGGKYNLNFALSAGSAPDALDIDYFKVYVKPGLPVTCETLDLAPGVDTYLILYDTNFREINRNEDIDRVSGNFASRVIYNVPYEGWLYALVGNVYQIDPKVAANYTYSFKCYIGSGPPITPATPIPGADRYEPNFNFDEATLVALGDKSPNLNFAPWAGSDPNAPDNDYFKVYVKPGRLVTCETLELAPGVDTNLILYDNNLNGIGGSEDIDRAHGNLASRVTYYVTYEGWLYALVGNVYQIDPTVAASYTYSFQCYIGSGPTATPTVTRIPVTPPTPIPTNTPTPSLVPTLTPTPTPTPPFIVVNEVATATPVGQQTVVVPISLLVYYDLNDNRSSDPGEGVVGISARVIDVITGQELQHGFTDANGFVSLTTRATGVVRLVVPYLSYSVVIQPSGSQITLRIAPSGLPISIP